MATSTRVSTKARESCWAAPTNRRERGWYVQPTLFADANNEMRIAREEIFGPVLTVLKYSRRARRHPHRQRQRLRAGRFGVDRRYRPRPRDRRRDPRRHLRHQHVHARHQLSRSADSSSPASGASSARGACPNTSNCSRRSARASCRSSAEPLGIAMTEVVVERHGAVLVCRLNRPAGAQRVDRGTARRVPGRAGRGPYGRCSGWWLRQAKAMRSARAPT